MRIGKRNDSVADRILRIVFDCHFDKSCRGNPAVAYCKRLSNLKPTVRIFQIHGYNALIEGYDDSAAVTVCRSVVPIAAPNGAPMMSVQHMRR